MGTRALLLKCFSWTLFIAMDSIFLQVQAEEQRCTAEISFNPAQEQCCNGEVITRNRRVKVICCGDRFHRAGPYDTCCDGTQMYNRDRQICCQGSVYAIDTGVCCGTDNLAWVDYSTHTCCNGVPRLGTVECCSTNSVLDPRTQLCCGDSIIPYDIKTIESGQQDHIHCCGLGSYNRLDQECCAKFNTVFDKSPFHVCCGGNYIDTRARICCGREDFREDFPIIDGKRDCCGSTPYNRAEKRCINEELSDKITGNSETICLSGAWKPYSPTLASCCQNEYLDNETPSIPDIQGCCGSHSYMKTHQMCHGGTLYDRTAGVVQDFCGTEIMDTSMYLCCNKQIVPKTSPFHRCCGSQTYDVNEHFCCQDQAGSQLSNITNGKCCGYQAYDSAEGTCCNGQLHNGVGLDENCCGTDIFNDNELCVIRAHHYPMKISKGQPNDDAWCKSRDDSIITYDSSEQYCVKGGSLMYYATTEKKCGARLYDINELICCNGVVHDRIEDGIEYQCCGSRRFDAATEECNAGVVVTKAPTMESCGRFYKYNSSTEECIEKTCVRPKELHEQYPLFCGTINLCADENQWYRFYNPDEKECCNKKLFGPGETCCMGNIFATPGTALGEGACCKGRPYNPNTHLCCQEELHNITENEGVACCGNRLYVPHDGVEICCDNNLWATAGEGTMCTNGVAHEPEEVLCGNVVLNTENQICCDNVLYSKEEQGDTCCGSQAYWSSDTYLLCCADSILHHDAQGKQCCHDQAIDPTVTSCCTQGGQQYGYSKEQAEMHCCADGSYDDAESTCCEGVLHFGIANGVCCGKDVVRNPDKEVCCGGSVETKYEDVETKVNPDKICCGGHMISVRNYFCCGTTKLNHYHSEKKCCNGVVFNKMDELCTDGTVFPRFPSISTTDIPQTTDVSFLPTMVGSTDMPQTTDESPPHVQLPPVCGNTEYNSTTQVCCEGQVISKFSGHKNCCSDKIYDIRNETCNHKGRVGRIRTGTPCGLNGDGIYGNSDITNKFVCCNNTFHRIKRGRDQCCGDVTFNPAKQECCSGEVIGLSEAKCCGGEKICIDESCCDGKPYEKGKDACCRGVIFGLDEKFDTTHCCPAGETLHKKSGRCIKKDCRICDNRQNNRWRKQICHKQYLYLASFNSYHRKEGTIIFESTMITLDRNAAQYQDEQKDIRVIVAKECKCQWITRKIRNLKKKGIVGKDFLIMTDNAVGEEGKLLLSEDDYIVEEDFELLGKAMDRILKKCDQERNG